MNAAFTALLLIYGSLWPSGTGFVFQEFSLCGIKNDKPENITFNYYFTFNRQLLLYYDNGDKQFSGCYNCIPEMWAFANNVTQHLNKDKKWLNQVKREEERCKVEVKTFWKKTVERKVKPSVEVFLPVQVHSENPPDLICYVWGFYPPDISVAWFKNDILVKNCTEAEPTGKWAYRIVADLDMRNSLPGDNYTCLVTHPTLDIAITKNWKPGLTDIQIIKISVASVIFALGLVCLIIGITLWMNSRKSEVSIVDEGSLTNVSTSPLLPCPSQSLVEEDMDLGEESETRSVQGELSVGDLSSLSSWGGSPLPFYQGCALKDGDEAQANDRRCVPI